MAADLEQGGIHLHQLNSDISSSRNEEERTAVDALCKVDESRLNAEEKQRLHTWEDAIQPHMKEGGDSAYIGDIYNGIHKLIAAEWHLEHPGEYLQFIKNVSRSDIQLEYLAHWMEVSTSPLKWRFLRNFPDNREERARRVKACVLDYNTQSLMRFEHCADANVLKDTISSVPSDCRLRIIIVEDLSRDLIETLGIPLDVDPRFFRQYINHHLFHNPGEPWALHPNLLSETHRQSYMTLAFLRARYFADESDFQEAHRQCGKFNVLRQLDSDRSRIALQQSVNCGTETSSVALARSKLAVWFTKEHDTSPVVAICLCDLTVVAGKPLWLGGKTAPGVLRPSTWVGQAQQVGEPSLFDQVVQGYGSLVPSDINHISQKIKLVAEPALKIMIKEWLLVVQYMRAQVTNMEWELSRPYFASSPADLAILEKKSSPWRRCLSYYESWVRDVLEHISILTKNDEQSDATRIDSVSRTNAAHLDGLEASIPDLERILRQLNEIAALIERVSIMASSAISQ